MHLKKNLLVVSLLTMGFAASGTAQNPPQEPQSGSMMDRCKQMMQMHQKWQSEMKAMDAELDKLVAEMNKAEGNKKVDAMAALLTRIVEQRKNMRSRMENMQSQMMGHMSEHMRAGSGSIASCPMMKGMHDTHGQHTPPKP